MVEGGPKLESSGADEAYEDRNLLALALASWALEQDFRAGVKREPDWSVVYQARLRQDGSRGRPMIEGESTEGPANPDSCDDCGEHYYA